ncbi:MAG TPA: ROK family protein [Candidatus Binataceae bacterium]
MKKSSAKPAAKSVNQDHGTPPRTLAVDVGGTGIKALTLDPGGKPINERTRLKTPKHATPKDVIEIIRELAKAQDGFERVSIGFPGVVKDGVIYTAANLGRGWEGFDLAQGVEHKLKKPVRIANDADIQGLGCVSGNGLELVVTLGTGFGSVLFADGVRVHLELAHHPFHRGKTYEDELGNRALKKKGRKKWNKLLREAIDDLQRTFNFDALFIGGGNSRLVTFKLPANVKTISNEEGLLGGIALWREKRGGLPQQASSAAPAMGKASAKAAPKGSKGSAKPAESSKFLAGKPAAAKAASARAKPAHSAAPGAHADDDASTTSGSSPANGSLKSDAS